MFGLTDAVALAIIAIFGQMLNLWMTDRVKRRTDAAFLAAEKAAELARAQGIKGDDRKTILEANTTQLTEIHKLVNGVSDIKHKQLFDQNEAQLKEIETLRREMAIIKKRLGVQ